ncbi:thiamine diphosphokinase [Candidatus Cloacimonadota bacterium]
MANTILIVANGEHIPPQKSKEIASTADLIIAADGGAEYCRENSIKFDYLIGDLDSLDDEFLTNIPSTKIIHNSDQNFTDMQKALAFCDNKAPVKIKIINSLGLRIDHSMINLLIFNSYRKPQILEIFDNFGHLRILLPGEHTLSFRKGQIISLFALIPVNNLTLAGFLYPVSQQSFQQPFIGISNKTSEEKVKISFTSGKLFLYEFYHK